MSRPLSRTTRLAIEPLERREMLSVSLPGVHSPAAFAAVTDDVGNTFALASALALANTGSGTQAGRIEQAGDVDVFRIVAPVTGKMTIREVAATGSTLDSFLYVYNGSQQLLAQNDDSGGTLNSQVQINAVAGSTYYIKAAGYSRSIGAYTVQISTTGNTPVLDDFGNTFAQATRLNLSGAGAGTQAGSIEQVGDVDMFSFVAPVTGQMTITESAASGSRLDSFLYAYNSAQQLVAQNDDSGTTLNSQVQINVVAGSTYYVKASAYTGSTGTYALQFSTVATTPTPPGTGNFQIDVTMAGFTAAQQQIVQQAVQRWEQVIVGDLPDVSYLGQTIDDVRIDLSAVAIDGVNGILGQAGPTAFRSGSNLPYLGTIELDTADVAAMQSNGTLLSVLEHEMAHVLGFGVIWSDLGLLSGAGSNDPRFTGSRATAEYNALFGTNVTGVPVESGGGSGTALSHWSESVFNNELMTGWINSGSTNPLSRITVASMADLGYQVNMAAADTYARPAAVSSTALRTNGSSTSSGSYGVWESLRAPAQHLRQPDRNAAIDLIMQTDYS